MTTPAIDNPPPSIAAAARLVQLASAPQSGCNCSSDTHEVDAGLCPIPTLQFPRFFAGQLVQPADLTAIEQRIFSHEQLRARHTIGWGVSCRQPEFIGLRSIPSLNSTWPEMLL